MDSSSGDIGELAICLAFVCNFVLYGLFTIFWRIRLDEVVRLELGSWVVMSLVLCLGGWEAFSRMFDYIRDDLVQSFTPSTPEDGA